mgnify:CR=1 FL=1
MTALGQSLFELFPDHGTDTRPDGSSKYVFPADRQHGAESVPLSATDLEPQAYNRQSPDLRFDVGIDGELFRRCGGFISVEAMYEAAMEKTKGEPFAQHARQDYLPEYR